VTEQLKTESALRAVDAGPEAASSETPPAEQLSADNNRDPAVSYSMSEGFVPFLARLDGSLAISSYQSGMFYLLGRNPNGGLMIDERFFRQAMGICADKGSLVLATAFQIQRFENVLEADQFINHVYDACYVPRIVYTTGALDAHEVGILDNGEIVFVNTRYNCLATLSRRHSFSVFWKPHFITRIVNEDRCHLNGMAMEDGRVRYVTAVSRSDTIDGWRDRRSDGGVVIDVATGEIVCEGLSMPHSPRIAGDKLWILNSGTGELGWVDCKAGKFHAAAFCPGFLRGLAIKGRYALVGLSKPRYKRFEGLVLDERLARADSEPWCGVQAIDLGTGTCVEWFRIDGAVSEIFDVALVPGVACPMSLGFASADIRTFITHDNPLAAGAAAPLPDDDGETR
jgi:uncharacterized protein (TIGR03032 family)